METQLYVADQTTAQPPAEPEVFLDEPGITVTKTRFVAGTQTFAMAGITSVQGIRVPPSRAGPLVLALFGVVLLIVCFGLENPIAGILIAAPLLIGSMVFAFLQKPTFSIVLTTAAGQVTAYNSPNAPFVARVIDAVTRAIIARG